MTKEEYITLKAARGDAATWDMEDCRAADALIRRVALANLERKTASLAEPYRTFVRTIARASYGSAEVDTFLRDLGCYPDWA